MSNRIRFVVATLLLSAVSAFAAQPKSVGITVLRAKLLAQGWKPMETFGANPDGQRWSFFGDAGELYRGGLIEVEACSGTGLNHCTFYYRKAQRCLQVSTRGEFKKGEYEPLVMETKKRCPPPDELNPPKR